MKTKIKNVKITVKEFKERVKKEIYKTNKEQFDIVFSTCKPNDIVIIPNSDLN